MALYGVGLDINLKRINLDFKLYIANKQGGINVRNLERLFKQFDTNGNGSLDLEEFTKALNNFGFFLKKVDYQILHKFYDTNGDGSISFPEFLAGIKEPLNQTRYQMIEKLFQEMDRNRDGRLTRDEVALYLKTDQLQSVVKKQQTEEQAFNEIFQEIDSDNDHFITQGEWVRYFSDLSLCYPSDQQFLEYLKNAWGFTDTHHFEVSNNDLRNIVKTLRYKLIQSTSGTHEEFLLKKLFNEFDTNKSGYITIDELYAMTIKLEIPIQKNSLQSVFKKFDTNNSGTIDFQEFTAFIINDPYP